MGQEARPPRWHVGTGAARASELGLGAGALAAPPSAASLWVRTATDRHHGRNLFQERKASHKRSRVSEIFPGFRITTLVHCQATCLSPHTTRAHRGEGQGDPAKLTWRQGLVADKQWPTSLDRCSCARRGGRSATGQGSRREPFGLSIKPFPQNTFTRNRVATWFCVTPTPVYEVHGLRVERGVKSAPKLIITGLRTAPSFPADPAPRGTAPCPPGWGAPVTELQAVLGPPREQDLL